MLGDKQEPPTISAHPRGHRVWLNVQGGMEGVTIFSMMFRWESRGEQSKHRSNFCGDMVPKNWANDDVLCYPTLNSKPNTSIFSSRGVDAGGDEMVLATGHHAASSACTAAPNLSRVKWIGPVCLLLATDAATSFIPIPCAEAVDTIQERRLILWWLSSRMMSQTGWGDFIQALKLCGDIQMHASPEISWQVSQKVWTEKFDGLQTK